MSDTSPTPHKDVPPLITWLITLGIVPATSFTATLVLMQNPWLALGITVLFTIVGGFVTGIWGDLQSRWSERVAIWIDLRVQDMSSGYWKYYKQQLIYRNRYFDVRGLGTTGTFNLSLEQVYVELSVEPKATHKGSFDPLQTSIEDSLSSPLQFSEGQPIWEFLNKEQYKHFVLLGPPGSGKTTLLKHIALALVTPRWRRMLRSIPSGVPFLLLLREHATLLKDQPELDLADVISAELKEWKRPVPPEWVERRLAKGNCLILLDGLDEVADPEQRQNMLNWVEEQMSRYGNNRFLITSRPFGYPKNLLSGVTVLQNRKFTPDQVEQFVHNWYLANEIMSSGKDDPGVRMQAEQGADDLLHRLHGTPALFDLAVNPLLLTMIATVHRYSGALPGKRIDLYKDICDVFLGRRREAIGVADELSSAQKQDVLQPLAYQMMCERKIIINFEEVQAIITDPLKLVNQRMPSKKFLRNVEETSGVFLEREVGVYSFAHLTFQEYLAATYMHENKMVDMLITHVEDLWWQETTRLYCAQEDATPVISACLANNPPSSPVLILALDCQNEAFKIQPAVSEQLNTLLKEGIDDVDLERRRIVVGTLLARRLREMEHVRAEIYRDTSFINCAEYQLFLDEQKAQGKSFRPDHWKEDHFQAGGANSPVLGVRPADAEAFCGWLTEQSKGLWNYRLPRPDEHQGSKGVSTTFDIGFWLEGGEQFVWVRESMGSLRERVRIHTEKPLKFEFMNHKLAQILDLDLDYNRVIQPPSGHSGPSDLTHDLDLAREIDRARKEARERDSTTIVISAHEPDRVNPLDQAFHRGLARARDLAHAIDLELDRALDLARALDPSSDRARSLIRTRDNARALARAIGHDHVPVSVLAHVPRIVQNIARAIDSALTLPGSPTRCQFLKLLSESFIRAFALVTILNSIYSQPSSKRSILSLFQDFLQSLTGRQSPPLPQKSSLDIALDIYDTFASLEQRIQGLQPACEGILIVKERQDTF